jgi:hypothetical protein
MIARVLLTFLVVIGATLLSTFFNPVATLVQGQVAGSQLAPSNGAFFTTQAVFAGFRYAYLLVDLSAFLIIVAIWFAPAVKTVKEMMTTLAILIAALIAFQPQTAQAFYETTDKTEAYTILPNWSAFWIPDVGDNKTDQASMDSADYLASKKVSLKRFIVPHAKLTGSAGNSMFAGWDAYVPTGRLILVDRTTYSHEWVDATDRGTSKSKEGFPCQSKEGINIVAGVSVGARVDEKDAPTFLYNFGVNAPKTQNMSDPQEIFRSVYYGRSLSEVMQDMGRKKIQTLVCNEIGKRGFDKANDEMIAIMDAVEKKSGDYFKSVGITVTFIGWADTFTFDKEIQNAVNSNYEKTVEASNAQKMAPYVSLLSTLAQADALRKWNGVVSTTTVNTSGLPDMILGAFGVNPNAAIAKSAGFPAAAPAK